VPATISFRQLILGLLGSGFLNAEQALAARITWATMSEARRADPLFAALIAEGHATTTQVDELLR
jgi:hypothetical protein